MPNPVFKVVFLHDDPTSFESQLNELSAQGYEAVDTAMGTRDGGVYFYALMVKK